MPSVRPLPSSGLFCLDADLHHLCWLVVDARKKEVEKAEPRTEKLQLLLRVGAVLAGGPPHPAR